MLAGLLGPLGSRESALRERSLSFAVVVVVVILFSSNLRVAPGVAAAAAASANWSRAFCLLLHLVQPARPSAKLAKSDGAPICQCRAILLGLQGKLMASARLARRQRSRLSNQSTRLARRLFERRQYLCIMHLRLASGVERQLWARR